MKPYSVLDLGKRSVVINGHTKIVTLEARLYDDRLHIGEYEPGEQGALARKITSGHITPTLIEVVATSPQCEQGRDMIGNCLVSSETNARNIVLEYGLIGIALNALVSATIARAAELERFTRPA